MGIELKISELQKLLELESLLIREILSLIKQENGNTERIHDSTEWDENVPYPGP
jgi:hypothetical protein